MVTTPFYLPVLGLIFLFTFSYLSIFPTMYKLLMVLLFYLFSVLLPTYLIHVYSKYEGWTTKQLINRERRMVPYVISILCYFLGFYLLTLMNTPDFISVIFVVAIIIQVLCAPSTGGGKFPSTVPASAVSPAWSSPSRSSSVSTPRGGCACCCSSPDSWVQRAWCSASTLWLRSSADTSSASPRDSSS